MHAVWISRSRLVSSVCESIPTGQLALLGSTLIINELPLASFNSGANLIRDSRVDQLFGVPNHCHVPSSISVLSYIQWYAEQSKIRCGFET